jgi:hypothetical protein
MTNISQDTAHDSNEATSVGGKYESMNKDGPNGSPYETLVKHDQSETKHDTQLECHVSSRTGHASQAFHMDYHWDRLRPYLVLPPRSMCRVMCRVMCYVAPFCDVLWCSDTSIGVVGFMTRSRIREEL